MSEEQAQLETRTLLRECGALLLEDHFVFLDEIALPAWPGASCPLRAQSVPVNTRYAHGAEFVEATGG